MRWIFLLVCLFAGCSDPVAPERPGVLLPSIVSIDPQTSLARVTRFAIELSDVAPMQLTLVAGLATDADVAALARGRPSEALRARMIPLVSWSEGAKTFAQPTRVLPGGEVSLIVSVDRLAPSRNVYQVSDDGTLARRVDPGSTGIYCVEGTLPALPERVSLAPSGSARVLVRPRVPCFELAPEGEGQVLPPPRIGELLIDPAPLGVPTTGPDPEPCAEDASMLSPLCARVLDDRLILVGDVAAPRLVLGTVGDRSVVAPLAPGARTPIVGLSGTSVAIDLFVRDLRSEWHVQQTVALAKPRRHVVVNEVLSHAPSGSSTQRFVEIANDGAKAAWLGNLVLADGDDRRPLPATWLEPGALALVVPRGFIDGLAGEVPPASGTMRLEVEALKLTGAIAILDDGGALSNFPASASTRTISRGRRVPSAPDDAPDAFGWDASGRATPGRPNAIE
ncbi:MAG: hypothetical protein ACXVEF_42115 [Polyangiales bacterium]